jgi:hypothetical protein
MKHMFRRIARPSLATPALSRAALFGSLLLAACGADGGAGDDADAEELALARQALCATGPLTRVAARSSADEVSWLGAALAIDGYAGTRWSSPFADPQWLEVDLGAPRYISSVALSWEAASAADYTVQLSTDRVSWTTAAVVTGAASGARVDTLSALTSRVGRYVRMHGTRRTSPWGYSLYELSVNGDADASCGLEDEPRDLADNLEAEDHDGMAGLQYEATTDVGGGQNAGWIDAGDHVEWRVNVPRNGSYALTTRSATWSAAGLRVLVDGAVRADLALPSTWTGGANQYQTWASFETAAFDLTAGEHVIRLQFTSGGQNLNYVKLSERNGPRSLVEIRTPYVDDYFFLSVNGVRHRLGYWGMDESLASSWRDISPLFKGGVNDVRVQAMNGGGPGGLDVEIRVDGGTPTRIVCPSADCETIADAALFIDRAVTLPPLNLPAAQQVTITSEHEGEIYINDEYTGLSTPATLELAPGTYTVGLGVSHDVPGAYEGRFFEREIAVSSAALSVDMQSQGEGLGVVRPVRIGLLPIRTVTSPRAPAPGVLSEADLQKTLAQFRATSEKLVEPLSYGLSAWDVTLLPMVTDRVVDMDYTCGLLEDPAYAGLVNQFDTVAIVHSEEDADGNHFFGGVGGYSVGHCISVPNTTGDHAPDDQPQPLFLHEMLHQVEGSQEREHHLFNGAEGLHGAEEHGYTHDWGLETDWLAWYRVFMRGQAGEVLGMRPGLHLEAPPASPSFYTGVFSIVRHGMRTPAPR